MTALPTDSLYAQLDAWIDAHFDDEVRYLQALVQVPTDTPPATMRPTPNARPSCSANGAMWPKSTPCRRPRCRPTGCKA